MLSCLRFKIDKLDKILVSVLCCFSLSPLCLLTVSYRYCVHCPVCFLSTKPIYVSQISNSFEWVPKMVLYLNCCSVFSWTLNSFKLQAFQMAHVIRLSFILCNEMHQHQFIVLKSSDLFKVETKMSHSQSKAMTLNYVIRLLHQKPFQNLIWKEKHLSCLKGMQKRLDWRKIEIFIQNLCLLPITLPLCRAPTRKGILNWIFAISF